MDIETELQNMVGLRVVVDQPYLQPPFVIGVLERMNDAYHVTDLGGQSGTDFPWFHVSKIQDGIIYLEDPDWEGPDSEDPFETDDLPLKHVTVDYEAWLDQEMPVVESDTGYQDENPYPDDYPDDL